MGKQGAIDTQGRMEKYNWADTQGGTRTQWGQKHQMEGADTQGGMDTHRTMDIQ